MTTEALISPKVNISARISLQTFRLLEEAANSSNKTKSELVDQCVRARLSAKKQKAAK